MHSSQIHASQSHGHEHGAQVRCGGVGSTRGSVGYSGIKGALWRPRGQAVSAPTPRTCLRALRSPTARTKPSVLCPPSLQAHQLLELPGLQQGSEGLGSFPQGPPGATVAPGVRDTPGTCVRVSAARCACPAPLPVSCVCSSLPSLCCHRECLRVPPPRSSAPTQPACGR